MRVGSGFWMTTMVTTSAFVFTLTFSYSFIGYVDVILHYRLKSFSLIFGLVTGYSRIFCNVPNILIY